MHWRRMHTLVEARRPSPRVLLVLANLAWILGNIFIFGAGISHKQRTGPLMIDQAYNLGFQSITKGRFTPGPVVDLMVLLLMLASIRWLVIYFRIFFGAGPIEVRPLDDASGLKKTDTHKLDVIFREYLTLPRLYQVTTVPGDPDPDRLIEILRTPTYSGWRDLVANAYAYALPRRAFIVSATLRTREHHHHQYGVSVQVRKLPGYAIELESQWSGNFERALQRAAYAVGAYILPHTKHCRNNPWSAWRGRSLPVSLFRDYQRAKRMATERRYDEALALYHRALLQDAENIGIRYDMGQLYERLGLYPDALFNYLKLVNEIFPARDPKSDGNPRRSARPHWRPEISTDPFVIRYRYVIVLGLGSALANELYLPDWPQLRAWLNLRPGSESDGSELENRPWRTSELHDIRRILSTELDALFPSLADNQSPGGTLLGLLRKSQQVLASRRRPRSCRTPPV